MENRFRDGVSGIQASALDVLDGGAVAAALGAIGHIDVLFNCAGIFHNISILDMIEGDLDFAFELNVKAVVRTVRAKIVLKIMFQSVLLPPKPMR